MKTIITLLCALTTLCSLPASAKDDKYKSSLKKTGTTPAKKSTAKKKAVKVEQVDQQVSKRVKDAILVTNTNLVKIAAKQMKIQGNSAKATAVVVYHSYLVDTSLALHINVRYENSKDFYTDKTAVGKYIVTINGDQSNFIILYTSHNKKFSLKYKYPDYSMKRKPTNAEMERDIMSAMGAINKKGKQKALKLESY